MNRETRIGLFVLMAAAAFAFFILRMEDEGFGKGLLDRTRSVEVLVEVDDASGIREGTAVRVSGVQVGKVKRLELVAGKALVVLSLPEGLAIPEDSQVELRTQGVLGERFVALLPGRSDRQVGSGRLKGATPVSLDDLTQTLSQIGDEVLALTRSLRSATVDEQGGNRMAAIASHVESLTASLAAAMEANRGAIDSTLQNTAALSGDLRRQLPELVAEMKALAAELRLMAQDNRARVDGTLERVHSISGKLDETMDSLRSTAQKVDSGKGVLGKLVNDEETGRKLDELMDSAKSSLSQLDTMLGQMNRLDLELGFRVDYLQHHQASTSAFQLRISPNPNKYYLLEAFSRDTDFFPAEYRTVLETRYDADGHVLGRSETLQPIEPKSFGFSGQLAYRVGPVFLRGGLLEGEGGGGVDWPLLGSKARLSFEAFDFSRPAELDPRARLAFEMGLGSGLQLRLGWDDLLERDYDSALFGLALRWKDADLKPLLSSLGSLAR